MSSVASGGAATELRRHAPALSADAVAWLAVPFCAGLTALAVLLLGPRLGALLFPFPHIAFLPGELEYMQPKPTESARYLLALGGPVLLARVTVTMSRRTLRLSPIAARAGVGLAQTALAALLVVCFVAQHDPAWVTPYFNDTTLVVAALVAVALLLLARDTRWRERIPALRIPPSALLAAAALLTAVWMLPGVNTAASMDWAYTAHDTAFYFDETFAVLNGLTPHVDFNAQYASLQPFLLALSLLTFGKTVLVYTITACAIGTLALLATYGVLRRATGSAAVAFALYRPFLATTLFVVPGVVAPLPNQSVRFTAGDYFAMLPLRYAGPYLLAWLVAWRLGRRGRRAVWPVLVAAGLVLVDNLEFGVAAFGATVAALLWTSVRPTARDVLRFAGAIAAGLGGALSLLTLLGLVRSGSLPDLAAATRFARLYGVAGYYVTRLAGVLGLPLVIYITYVAAIATATVRALRHDPNRVLTGMLAWVGVFGLGSAPYYVARSFAFQLPMLFSAWALALALLAFVALRHAASTRRLAPASLAVLFGLGLAACSLAQLPLPWVQLQRIQRPPAGAKVLPATWAQPPSHSPAARSFFAGIVDGNRFVVVHGAPVLLLFTTGHYVADAYGVRDVMRYTGPESIHTVAELDETLATLRAAGGNTLVTSVEQLARLGPLLRERGFGLMTGQGFVASWADEAPPVDTFVLDGFVKLVDLHDLHPRAAS